MGVGISKGSIGPNAEGSDTSPSLLVTNAPAIVGKIAVNTSVQISSVKQAELLGITPEYDLTNDVVFHRHITDFYEMAGEGVKLNLLIVAAASPSDLFDDVVSTMIRKVIADERGAIVNVGLAWNISAATAEVITDGFSSVIRSAIAKAQDFANWAYATDRPVHVLLEGRAMADNMATPISMRAIPVGAAILEAVKVSVVVGQDWQYAEDRFNIATKPVGSKVHKYAAVGAALGTLAAAQMEQSIAEVAVFNLSNATKGFFVIGGLSNHKKLSEAEAFLADLDTKGYIFPITFPRTSGLRWNNDHVCSPIIIDANGNYNEHMIYYSRTLDQAAMRLKSHLLTLLKRRVLADSATGKLPSVVIRNLEADADEQVFKKMANQAHIVAGKTFINKDSDLVSPPKTLLANFKVVAYQIIDNIAGKINLVKSIQL
ncbi:MAG: hypothetical protein EAZ35_02215 [Sphingobacteriia bacterium]|nr:MAG: hypothetical protein EAZ35_02215 [Sphingobacteriia bacterium]